MDGIRDVLPSPGEARGSDFATSARTIGVVIRTLDESALIGRCLETLRRQRGGFDLDVVVVDSGSTDLTLEIARSHDARIVELSPDDFDYSRALNVGIEESRGELVVSLSAHAIPVDDDWLTKMTSPFAEPRVAGVTSRQVPWPDAPWQEVHRLGRQFLDQRMCLRGARAIRRSCSATQRRRFGGVLGGTNRSRFQPPRTSSGHSE